MLLPFVVAVVILALIFGTDTLHTIEEGHRGVYYRGGSLLSTCTKPGFNYKIPAITTYHNVQVTVQTDKLDHVPCGSSQGGTAHLDIEVVNRLLPSDACVLKAVSEFTVDYDKPLIFDFVPSEVAQFCKNYSIEDIYIRQFDKLDEVLLEKLKGNVEAYGMGGCLEVLRLRISRPKLSPALQERFEAIEHEEKARDLQAKRIETERATLEAEAQRAKMTQQRRQDEMRIEMETAVLRERKRAEIAAIDSETRAKQRATKAEADRLAQVKAVDAEAYGKQKDAEAVTQMLTAFAKGAPDGTVQISPVAAFLEWHRTKAFWASTNKVFYFGDSADHMPKVLYNHDWKREHARNSTTAMDAAVHIPRSANRTHTLEELL
jgi:regulator of protease activity HflC (stomatin/prohibitin superfamily)